MSLFVAGLREGFIILTVSVALAGAFAGLRGGLAIVASTVLVAWLAPWFHVGVEPSAAQRFVDSAYSDAWILQILVFAGLSLMMVVVQSRHTAAVYASNERARSFAAVAERSTAAVAFTDPERQMVWVNEAFTRLTGYGVEDAVGQTPGSLLQGPGTDPAEVARMGVALAALRPIRVDLVNYRKGGAPYWVRVAVEPYHDEAGVLRGFTGSQQDMTSERMSALSDDVERALLAEFAAAPSGSLDTPLVRNLACCETASWIRVWRRGLAGLRSIETVLPESRLGPVMQPAALELSEGFEGVALHAAERDDVPTERIIAALGDGTDEVVEIGVWRAMPGKDAIMRRLPPLPALHALFVRQRAEAQHVVEVFAQSPEALHGAPSGPCPGCTRSTGQQGPRAADASLSAARCTRCCGSTSRPFWPAQASSMAPACLAS